MLMKGSGYGVIGDIVLGIIGGLVGGWIVSLLNLPSAGGFNLYSLIVAVIGAVVVVAIARAVSGRRVAP
jgi:uncharacterized membrane protein YeaQ/YmgE (transglycosylase-associated protein family)